MAKDRLQEISMRLEQSHLVYLQTDDCPLKLQQRHKLEGFVKEYLCLVPNNSKYIFRETANILHHSAATLHDFSGYRACTAWNAISLYAANLLAQPWRKEYKTLRTYSGYYKHEVETNLIGAELMFELMGYKHTDLGVLTLEGSIDPDRVLNVSRDAIVAFVECQILKEIWENVSQKFPVSWLEVLEFRETYAGTPERAIRVLRHRLERTHQVRHKSERYHHRRLSLSPSTPFEDGLVEEERPVDTGHSPTRVRGTRVPTGRLIELDAPGQVEPEALFTGSETWGPRRAPRRASRTLELDWPASAGRTRDFSPEERSTRLANGEATVRRTRSCFDSVDLGALRVDSPTGDSRSRWNCSTCTYLNDASRRICEMCGKSRKKGNEEKPLASGGKECPQCTLVNERDASLCDACGASLKDSPTYI
ncbi:uncharacterized protein LOC105697209 [Orussus abietinus]|uniref:uncharacterized protein LOC105697209 n=1 Tax=Orussus abietinus TaxID=222816 RepID=UPI00062519BB|nr:uncharacterized protein LOC105697209 [Orussus abietinus]XP_012275758.1 uncharacterized protein LOC105697209 [Orussus abietinus]